MNVSNSAVPVHIPLFVKLLVSRKGQRISFVGLDGLEFQCVAEGDLEHETSYLSLSSDCWDYRHVLFIPSFVLY